MSTRSIVLVVALAATACASGYKRPSEPKPESSATGAASERSDADAAATPAQAGAADSHDNLQMVDFQAQFDQQLADLERLDCGNACRALGSLERSADNICGITGAKSTTCQDVQKKREDAKGRVRDRCGTCP